MIEKEEINSAKSQELTVNDDDDDDGDNCQINCIAIADVSLNDKTVNEFKRWFSDVNKKILSKFDGYVSRILVQSSDCQYRIIFMTRDRKTLMAIRASITHREIHEKSLKFMSRPPIISFYDVIAR